MAGWCIYTHRRMVDRHHFGFAPGSEAVILNWPAHGYQLGTLPQHVVDALEANEPGASRKNLVEMSHAQRHIVYEDAKQRALEFVYYLQTAAHDRVGDFPQSFRYMELADDYGTSDRLRPKPYLREGLRLEAMTIITELDVRTESHEPKWAKTMYPDSVFGWQFNLDFHPTRRKFVDDDPTKPWQGHHHGSRDWSTDTDRATFPLRGLVAVEMEGLLGASKNLGVTSMVQSALRLHGQMMHVGTASGTVAAIALREGISPREIATTPERVAEIQRILVRGAGGPGTLLLALARSFSRRPLVRSRQSPDTRGHLETRSRQRLFRTPPSRDPRRARRSPRAPPRDDGRRPRQTRPTQCGSLFRPAARSSRSRGRRDDAAMGELSVNRRRPSLRRSPQLGRPQPLARRDGRPGFPHLARQSRKRRPDPRGMR